VNWQVIAFLIFNLSAEALQDYRAERFYCGLPQLAIAGGQSRWPFDPLRSYEYYGYRAAECMNISSGIYGNTTKWRGALAMQTVNPSVTLAIFEATETASVSEQRE